MQNEFNLVGVKVCIGIPCYSGYIPIELGIALAEVVSVLNGYGVSTTIVAERENALITESRNKVLHRFLKETTCDYLFWIDDDMIFKPLDFVHVLAIATVKKSAAATYTTRTDINPVFFVQSIGEQIEFDEDGHIPAKAVGLGFACQHRSILEPLLEGKQIYKDKDDLMVTEIFKLCVKDGESWGEDVLFFNELYDAGFPVFVIPTIHLIHVGRKDYNYRFMTKKE